MDQLISQVILTYHKSGEKIIIDCFPGIIGRENIGKEVLGKIKNHDNEFLISRTHCVIIPSGKSISIRDANSKNGTFILKGSTTLKCSNTDWTEITSKDILILGQENFFIEIIVRLNEIKFICKNCGFVYNEEPGKICKQCGIANEFEKKFV